MQLYDCTTEDMRMHTKHKKQIKNNCIVYVEKEKWGGRGKFDKFLYKKHFNFTASIQKRPFLLRFFPLKYSCFNKFVIQLKFQIKFHSYVVCVCLYNMIMVMHFKWIHRILKTDEQTRCKLVYQIKIRDLHRVSVTCIFIDCVLKPEKCLNQIKYLFPVRLKFIQMVLYASVLLNKEKKNQSNCKKKNIN